MRAQPSLTPMHRGRLPASSCRQQPLDGPERPSGRNALPSGITPSTIMSPTRSHPGPRTEIRLGARAHHTRTSDRAHAPHHQQLQPRQPGRRVCRGVPAQIRRGHPWPPWAARSGGQPPAGPCAPLHELPPTGSTCGRAKGREQSPATSCRGALPPMKRLQGWGRPPDKARVRREAGQAFAQPGRRAILGGLGAPPLIQRAP
jgi:hypothetical protein